MLASLEAFLHVFFLCHTQLGQVGVLEREENVVEDAIFVAASNLGQAGSSLPGVKGGRGRHTNLDLRCV